MPRSADGPRQAGTIAAGAFDAERLNPPVCVGPHEQGLISARISDERVIAQADPPGVDRHRDVDMLVGIDPDNHLPNLGLRGHGVRHRGLLLPQGLGVHGSGSGPLIAYLREENRVLREHLGPRPLRRTDAQRRRLAVRGQQLGRRVLMQVAGIVTPDTILRWYRRLIAQTYDGSARRGRGRPMTRRDVAALVVRMAVEHPQWGYTRIRGALSHLGHEIARTTVKRILHDHGIDPAPERSRRLPWKTFLQAHWEGLTACDLFTVEVLTLAGLQRYLVFFVIALQSRRVPSPGSIRSRTARGWSRWPAI